MYDQNIAIEKNDNQRYFSQALAPLQDQTTSEINDYDILLIKEFIHWHIAKRIKSY
jgi:hypothetical protein